MTNGIGAGTVSNIIDEWKKRVHDSDYESVFCKKQGITLDALASCIRLNNYIQSLGANANESTLESLIANLANYPDRDPAMMPLSVFDLLTNPKIKYWPIPHIATIIAVNNATPQVEANSFPKDIFRRVDYSVLVFFAAMFIVISALWSSGAISMLMLHIPSPNPSNIVQSNTIVSVVSILLSQILSNVPFVALYNLVLLNNGFAGDAHVSQWMMLASTSTIAGNLTILGASPQKEIDLKVFKRLV
jgi:hypothetical protein